MVKQKKTGLGILKGLPFLLGLNLKHGAEKLTVLWAQGLLKASNGLCTFTSIVLPDRDHSHFHHCLLHHQESGQHPGSFWMCSDTSLDNIFETGKEFYFLASVFTLPSSCSGIQVRSKVQAVACLQVSPDLIQVGILPSLVPWKWTENVFWRHLENGFRYYYVEWHRDNLWP